jgi:lysyl-tRNA synthetase class 1
MAEKFFWADALAERIIKERGKKKEYVCASGITPSGKVHIGNFREVITTELVVRAFKEKGVKVKFIYSWDDYDRFRKVPKGIDKSYEKYIGVPISDIPSPFDKKKNYAEYNEKIFEKSLEVVGIKPKFIYQNEMNKKSKYAELIKVALEKKDVIIDILNKYRKEPLAKGWMPVMIYCEKCKKDSTKIISVDNYEIGYECACGHKEKFDFRKKGLISVKWRVDWPMRWKYEGVDFEPGGIDHSVYGSSFTTAKEISKQVFDYMPPIYQFYDWVNVKGGAMFSSSAGNALDLNDVGEVYEPEVLRYLFVRMKPKTGFAISFDNDVIAFYDEYDRLEERYYNNKLNPKEKRMYEMCQVKLEKKKPLRTSFRHLITLVQIGQLKGLNKRDKLRAEKVSNWLEKYAGEDMKFRVQEKVNVKLSKKEKEALTELRKVLEKKNYSEKELFDKFYEICEKAGIKNTEFFDAAYRVLINKKKGPRLASLILIVGKEKIIKLLKQIK